RHPFSFSPIRPHPTSSLFPYTDALPIFDLVEDMARHDDALAGAAPLLDQPNRPAPHDRIHAAERLVEDEQLRIVSDGLRELHALDRKSTRLNSSHVAISYAVFCLKKKTL